MSDTYSGHLQQTPAARRETPAPLPGMVPGSSGPETWPVDNWTRLDRFLILGHEGGSYYASARTMTHEAAGALTRCLMADPARTLARIVEISQSGRAPKNDPAVFALALCAATGDVRVRREAFALLPRVCRIGTHLFHFMRDYEALRPKNRYGRAVKRMLAQWYEGKPIDRLAYEVIKYRQRDGWSHRDVLRLAHPRGQASPYHGALYKWVAKGVLPTATDLGLIQAFEVCQVAPGTVPTDQQIQAVAEIAEKSRLPWEAIAPEFLKGHQVWRQVVKSMPYEATVRNLGNLTRNGTLGEAETLTLVLDRIADAEAQRKARFHPIKALTALRTYASGQPLRGRGEGWTPIPTLTQALDRAFYTAFGQITPRPGKLVIALDVSGSMGGGQVAGIPGLTPRNASAALALVFLRQFPDHEVVAFSASGVRVGRGRGYSNTNGISRLPLTPGLRLDQAEQIVDGLDFGATDCSLPMLWAQREGIKADAFVILTDSETNSHAIHPSRALQQYRQKLGVAAKLVVVGMVSNWFSIADPNDAGMLDVVGFDTAVPGLIADFIAPEERREPVDEVVE